MSPVLSPASSSSPITRWPGSWDAAAALGAQLDGRLTCVSLGPPLSAPARRGPLSGSSHSCVGVQALRITRLVCYPPSNVRTVASRTAVPKETHTHSQRGPCVSHTCRRACFRGSVGGAGWNRAVPGGGEQRVNAAAPGPHFRLSGECSLCCRPSPGPQAPKASLAPGAPGRPLTCSCSRPWVLGARLLPGVLSLPTPQLSPWDGSAHARPGAADHFGCHEGGGR